MNYNYKEIYYFITFCAVSDCEQEDDHGLVVSSMR